MNAHERAMQRLRNAARRLGEANEELEKAERELVEASHALDILEQANLPTAAEMRGVLRHS